MFRKLKEIFVKTVPLEPRGPRFDEVTASSVRLRWAPPENANELGRDLLGYRIYMRENCVGSGNTDCGRQVAPVTVTSAKQLSVVVNELGKFL